MRSKSSAPKAIPDAPPASDDRSREDFDQTGNRECRLFSLSGHLATAGEGFC